MIKTSLISVLAVVVVGCSKQPKPTELSDDYVLIEFAARLEEDYQRLYPEPLEKNNKTLPE